MSDFDLQKQICLCDLPVQVRFRFKIKNLTLTSQVLMRATDLNLREFVGDAYDLRLVVC